MNKITIPLLGGAILATSLAAWSLQALGQATASPAVQSPKPLSPAETLATVKLPKGYRMECVLAEPDIKEPVAAAFDGDGRMFVAEMRTYMQDIDGTDEHKPVSRVSLHWSSGKDGKLDKHTVFIDKLLLPRMILPLGKGELLVNETDTQDIHLYTDTDGDGVADKKVLWFEGGPRGGNMEHQQSGLIWSMDNWLYCTYNAWRLRWTPGHGAPLKEPTPGNGGQWGLTQDDFGKPWFVNAGGERGPLNFQTHILYGGYNLEKQFEEGYKQVWPAVGLADVQGGANRFRPEDKTLNHFTATCGAEVFRGDRLPADLRGDLLFSEPVGRLIRRTKAEVKDALTYLRNAYDKSEFILSTDPYFRVVNMNTAPDGTLYLVDMYRGIIQEGNWVREGSYLRGVVKEHGLDKVAGHGRIWRLVHDEFKPGPQPTMHSDSPADLVRHLEHPNGWWRDTAQKLLVLKQDRSVVPALKGMVSSSKDIKSRMHALWALEGLGAADAATVRAAMKDGAAEMRSAAIRVSETLYKAGDVSFADDYANLAKDADAKVVLQSVLTAKLLGTPQAKDLLQACAFGKIGTPGTKEIAMQTMAPKRSWGREFSGAQKALLDKGDAIYRELCFACHNPDGKGAPIDGKPGVTLAPPLANSRTVNGSKEAFIAVLLKGLAGPINGKTYEAQMLAMESNNDEWIASIASYVRNSFGNKSSTVTTADVAKVRKEVAERTAPWTVDDLKVFGPPTVSRNGWKLDASHNPEGMARAVDGQIETRYDTRKAQVPGMWISVTLPKEEMVSGLKLDATGSANDYPRGFEVYLSADGTTWGQPVAKGEGKSALLEVKFPAAKVKAVRVVQTGEAKGNFWSIHELELLSTEPAKTAGK